MTVRYKLSSAMMHKERGNLPPRLQLLGEGYGRGCGQDQRHPGKLCLFQMLVIHVKSAGRWEERNCQLGVENYPVSYSVRWS